MFTNLIANAQIKTRIGFGISDIIFKKYGQSPYLSYEINTLVHRLPAISFQAGVSKQVALSQRFDLNSGLLFSKQGLNYDSDFLYDKIAYRLNLFYLKVPVLFQYKTNIRKDRQSGIYVGPYIAGLLKASRVKEVQGELEKEKMENVNNFDFGGVVGYSWDVGKSPGQLYLDARCTYSLVNSMKEMDGNIPWYYGPEKKYVRNVNIVLAFEFQL